MEIKWKLERMWWWRGEYMCTSIVLYPVNEIGLNYGNELFYILNIREIQHNLK